MNVKFLNPFIEAAHEVLKTETGLDLIRKSLTLENDEYVTDDVTVILNLIGQVEGTVLYSMTIGTALTLISKMMGEEISKFDNFAQSGVAELGNVITGKASVKLSDQGFISNISTPTMLIGKGATISTLGLSRLVVPLTSNGAEVTIHLALRQSNTVIKSASEIPNAPKL